MGAARFLNVFLGASPALPELLFSNNNILIARIIIASASLFLYVLAISILSRMEVGATLSAQTVKGPFLIIFAVIAIIVVAGLVKVFRIELVVSLMLFAGIIIITFKRTMFEDYYSPVFKRLSRPSVISIIVLDSVFCSGTAGLYYRLSTLLLIIPSIV